MNPIEKISGTDPSIIQSLNRGLLILELVGNAEDSVSLTELARKLGWDKSTIFRLLSTLIKRGYILQDPHTKRYSLGFKIFELNYFLQTKLKIEEFSSDFLRELSNLSRESSHLAILSKDEITIINQQNSPEKVAVNTHIGATEPLHCTALGKVIFAYQSQEMIEQIIKRKRLLEYTKNTIIDPDEMKRHLEKIRKDGYAVDDEEYELGIRCVAAPVRDSLGQVKYAVGISGPSFRIIYRRIPDLAKLVVDISQEMSIRLGYRGLEVASS